MDYWTVIPVALAVGFFVSAMDYWVYIVFWRGIIGLGAAVGLFYWQGTTGVNLVIASTAATFTALAVIEIVDRITKTVLPVRR